MNTACPQCGSNQTQPLDVIYSSGTSKGSATTQSFGTNYQGDFTQSTGFTSYGSSTLLASRVAPPRRPAYPVTSWFVAVLALGAGWFLNAVTENSKRLGNEYKSAESLATLCWVIAVFLIIYALVKIANANSNMPDYRRNFAEWSNSRFCFSCSLTYKPSSAVKSFSVSNAESKRGDLGTIEVKDLAISFNYSRPSSKIVRVFLAEENGALKFVGKLPYTTTLEPGKYNFELDSGSDTQAGSFKILPKEVKVVPIENLQGKAAVDAKIEKLKEVAGLLKEGLISKEDFDKIKNEIIG